MIRSFVFSDGRLAARDVEWEALRLIRADPGLLLWIDLEAPTPEEVKQVLEATFGFHALAIEDCMTPSSLPKIEDYGDYLFLVVHAVDFTRTAKFQSTELDLFLGKDFLVTYHTTPLRPVQTAIDRCLKNVAPIRGPDRLAHGLLDALVDHYQPSLEELRAELDEIEERVLGESGSGLIGDLIEVRKELSLLRQIVRPQREVIARLGQGESKLIRPHLVPYFRHLRDGLSRIDETAVTYADQLLISFDLFVNKSAHETNEGIKVLTALTAVTLPPILVGTWYGMNFEHMPELEAPYGYAMVAVVTLALTALTWRWVRRKGWL